MQACYPQSVEVPDVWHEAHNGLRTDQVSANLCLKHDLLQWDGEKVGFVPRRLIATNLYFAI